MQGLKDKQQNKAVLYEQIIPPDQTVTKTDMELQPNPAYGTSHKVIIDANPAYESYKWLVLTMWFSYSLKVPIVAYIHMCVQVTR